MMKEGWPVVLTEDQVNGPITLRGGARGYVKQVGANGPADGWVQVEWFSGDDIGYIRQEFLIPIQELDIAGLGDAIMYTVQQWDSMDDLVRQIVTAARAIGLSEYGIKTGTLQAVIFYVLSKLGLPVGDDMRIIGQGFKPDDLLNG